MNDYLIQQIKKERSCEVCSVKFLATNRLKKLCVGCREKMDFLRHRVPAYYGGPMNSERARKYLKDHPGFEVPKVKKVIYSLSY